MSIVVDLDQWAAELANKTGLRVTRDPDLINPPCLFIDLPVIQSRTQQGLVAQVPVAYIAAGAGKQAGDDILDNLFTFMEGVGAPAANPQTLTIGEINYSTVVATATVTISKG